MESSSEVAVSSQNEEMAVDRLHTAESRLFDYLNNASISSEVGNVQPLSTSKLYNTDAGIPHLQIVKSELYGRFFTDEVASIGTFMGHDIKFPDVSFDEDELDSEEYDRICTFLLYLMSVQPDFVLSQQCYNELLKKHYTPPPAVLLNILLNWGASMKDLFQVVPERFKDLGNAKESNLDKKPKGTQGCNFNHVFQYIKYVLLKFPTLNYVDLLEPFLRLSLDVTVFTTRAFIIAKQCINLIICKLSETDSLYVKNFHLEDLDLQSQSFLCLINLRSTSIGIPLAYATLQQFLGEPNIIYSAKVDFKSLFSLVSEKRERIMKSTYSDLLSFLKLIRYLLFSNMGKRKGGTNQMNGRDWISLLDDWSSHVPSYSDKDKSRNIKDCIAYIQHTLKMYL